jgi:hypothetical protein
LVLWVNYPDWKVSGRVHGTGYFPGSRRLLKYPDGPVAFMPSLLHRVGSVQVYVRVICSTA